MFLLPFCSAQTSVDEVTGYPVGWSNDVNISNSPTQRDVEPAIAIKDNAIHLVWRHNSASTRDIRYIKSTDGGRIWSQNITLATSTDFAYEPEISIFENNIHVVWGDYLGWNGVYYRNSTDNGETWNPIKRMSQDGMDCYGPQIYSNNSNVHIIWYDVRDGVDGEIYYRRSLDGGITWDNGQGIDDDRRITFSSATISGIQMAGDGSNISVAWADERDGDWEIYWMISKDNGLTWEDGLGNPDVDRKISNSVDDSFGRSIAVDGSNIHIVWYEEQWPGPVYRIYYRNSTDSGLTWNPIQLLSGPNTASFAPNIDVCGDNVWVMWNDNRDGSHEVFFKNSTDGGISWGADTRLTEMDGNLSGAPKIALNEFAIHVTWEDERVGTQKEIFYKRFPHFPAVDTEPPEINHAPVVSANVFNLINITANITDNVSVNTVFLNFTDVHGINQNISMTQWNGNWSYDIPGQDNTGFVDYFIWCNDTNDNANQTTVYQIQINDITDPEINHFPVASANVFDVINITANITDDVAVNLVYLNYTRVNGTHYNVSMQKWNGNYSYEISGQNNIGFVDYFIWANDTSNNDNITLTYQIQINDITKPEINHAPVASKNIGEIINITANITDDVSVNKILLNYTDVHGVNQNITMNKWDEKYSFDIPGQSNSGFVSYFIWANDSSDNDNQTIIYQIQIFDVTDPEINHMPISSANISEPINITANVTDDVSVNSVYLNYTGVNGTSYNVSMQKWNGNYSYEIPDQDTVGNVQYFIWANDSDGNDNRTQTYQVQIFDIIDPEINHVSVVSAVIGEAINIIVNVTDDVEVDKIYLNYTDVEGNNYNVSMNKYNGNWSYEIAGQDDIGVVEYFIWANDTSGNDNQTLVYQSLIIDVVKPEIEHTPVTSVNVSEANNITAKITDDIEVDSVYLNYTGVDGVNHNVSMSKWNGNWSFDIPGQASAGMIEYFIWCNDTSGNDNRTIEYTIQINEVIIPNTTPPTIISKTPTGVNVSISTAITITFNESMNISSVQNSITFSPAITISGYNWNANNITLTITPSANLSYNTTYNITVGVGAKDIAGNNLESAYSWDFSTQPEPTINNLDDGGIGEYWWIILIIVVVVIFVLYLYWRTQKEEEPEEYIEDSEVPIEKPE